MTIKTELDRVVASLPEERLAQLLDYARFLGWQEERRAWQEFGRNQLARAYGPDESDYSEAAIKPELNR